jgi:hypothetical protein
MSRFVFLAVAKTAVVASVVIFAGTSTGLGRDSTPKGNAIQRGSRSYGMLPLVFEANQGQTDAKAKFIARGAG